MSSASVRGSSPTLTEVSGRHPYCCVAFDKSPALVSELTDILGSASIYLTSFLVTGGQHVTAGAMFLEVVFLLNVCLEMAKAPELPVADPWKEPYILDGWLEALASPGSATGGR